MSDLLEIKMAKLWTLCTEMYGHRWTSSMGEEPNATWIDACRPFEDEQWRNAVMMLKGSTDDWPPTLPTFRRWAYLGTTAVEAREHAARKADEIVAGRIARYNPNCAGMTQQEADRLQTRLARSLYVDHLDRERNAALGIEHDSGRDPLRICPDEEYR